MTTEAYFGESILRFCSLGAIDFYPYLFINRSFIKMIFVSFISRILVWFRIRNLILILGPLMQSVVSKTTDPGIASSILAWSHIFVKIDHEIISTAILLLLLIQEELFSVTSECMCRKYWLACLGKSVVR